jgi:hypothetical protein
LGGLLNVEDFASRVHGTESGRRVGVWSWGKKDTVMGRKCSTAEREEQPTFLLTGVAVALTVLLLKPGKHLASNQCFLCLAEQPFVLVGTLGGGTE